jgi:hypothetical protein
VRDPSSDAGTPFRAGNNTAAAPTNRPDLNAARSMGSNSSAPQISVSKRPDMRGPTDISNILSGLKTKTIQVQPQSQQQQPQSQQPQSQSQSQQQQSQSQSQSQQQQPQSQSDDKTSTISISDLKELQNDHLPHKSKRRQRSDKNTVSLALDI